MKYSHVNRTEKRKVSVVFLFSMFLFATAFGFPAKKAKAPKLIIPPGTIEIADGLYCDVSESSNVDYREYMYWIRTVYGSESGEYAKVLPDTSVWSKGEACLYFAEELYLRHPQYDDYPVVGVSQEQAKLYAKWRSDRVMEFWLVKNGFIENYQAPSLEKGLFTIEAYFNGELSWVKPSSEVEFYPEYRLPNMEERKLILKYADANLSSKERNKKQIDNLVGEIICGVQPCSKKQGKNLPMKSSSVGLDKKLAPVVHLRGNVAEWGSDDDVAFGGSWNNTEKQIVSNDVNQVSKPSFDVGFRNVCEWKKWKK